MKTLSRALSALSLVAWGTLMLYFFWSGRLAEYLIPVYRPMVAIAGGVMLVLAGCLLWTGRSDADGFGAAAPRLRATQVLAFLMLVVPIWAAVGVSADRFSIGTMRNRGIVSDPSKLPGKAAPAAPAAASTNYEPPLPGATPIPADATPSTLDASQYLKKTPDGNVIAEVTDLLFASDDDSMRPLFEKRKVEMIGQFMPAEKSGGKRFQIVRMFMVCCAADARPVAVAVDSAEVPKLAEMAWARVIGTVSFPVEDGRRIPVLHAEVIKACDPPAELMLY